MAKNPIDYEEINISSRITVYAVEIEELDDSFIKYIDKKLVKICKGKRKIELKTVKMGFIKYLDSKGKSTLLTGSVSEFFIHLFLSSQKFKQEFLYFNLEENSIKKGFDGYYTKGNENWILESKSSIITTTKHRSTINTAYKGVKDKIEGVDNKNNPWENAYSHAKHGDVKAKKNVTKKISALSDLYTNEIYGKIDDFNIMASSTIFLEKDWKSIDKKELKIEIEDYLSDKMFKNIIVICLNKKSIKHLIDYLKL